VPFPDATALFVHWADYPPPSESILVLLTAFTTFKLPSSAGGRRVIREYGEEDEVRDISGLSQQLGVRPMAASSLPEYMKQTMNKEFGLNIQ
jgi:hypothetical protein